MKKILLAASVASVAGLVLAPNASAANSETLAEFTNAVNEMAAKYSLAPIPVKPDAQMTSGGHVAAAREGQYIDLSQRWGALPPAQFNTEVNTMAKGGCSAIRGTAIHEVGHIVEARNGFQARNELNAAASRGEIQILQNEVDPRSLEADGTLNENEALAYAFQSVECGSATPSEQKIYDILVK